MGRFRIALVVILTVGCTKQDRDGPARSSGGSGTATTAVVANGSGSASVAPATVGSGSGSAIAAPTPVAPVVVPTGWPRVEWTRAEAILFNWFEARHGVPLLAWSPDDGMTSHIEKRKPIDVELAKRAAQLVDKAGGSSEVSKCPFPRHAIVYFHGDRPVASVNVCFQCGDILVIPDPRPPEPDEPVPNDDDILNPKPLTKAELARIDRQLAEDEKRWKIAAQKYRVVFPVWKKLFRDDIGFPLAPPGGSIRADDE